MTIQFGRNAFVNVSNTPESTYGSVSGATYDVYNRIFSCSLQKTQTREQVTHLSTSNGAFSRAQFAVQTEVSGTVEMPLMYEGSGVWLKYALGSASSTGGSAPHTHTYDPDTTNLDSFCLKFQRGTGGMELFKGLMVASMTISCAAGEEARLSCDLIGQDSDARAGSISPTFGTGAQVLHNQCDTSALRYTPDGGSLQQFTLRSFEFTIDNKLEDRRTLGSLLTSSPAVTDIRDVTVSCVADLEDETIYNHQLDGTSGTLSIQYTSGTDQFIIILNNSFCVEYSDEVNSVGRLERSFTFKGLAASTGSGEACQLQVINGDSSAVSN
jgi:hypothetical protein